MSFLGITINNNTTPVLGWLQWKTFLPIDIASLTSLVVLLAGILGNAFLGLYVGEKFRKPCGIRTLICNQILANLVTLFSYVFVPLGVLDERTKCNLVRLCRVMPSLGFIAVSVALINTAAACVSYYHAKRGGKFALTSMGASLLFVVFSWLLGAALTVPMSMSLNMIEVTVNETIATVCVAVWPNDNYRNIYMSCVLIVKFSLPVLAMFNVCIKTELVHLTSKRMKHYRKILSTLTDVLTVICLFLLVYFFPLSSIGRGKLFISTVMTHAIDIVRILELLALANCAIVPMLFTIYVDEYHNIELARDRPKTAKHLPYLTDTNKIKEDASDIHGNASYVTYDVLTADMPEKWRPSPSGVLIV